MIAQKRLAFLLMFSGNLQPYREQIHYFPNKRIYLTRDCIKEIVGERLYIRSSLGIQREIKTFHSCNVNERLAGIETGLGPEG